MGSKGLYSYMCLTCTGGFVARVSYLKTWALYWIHSLSRIHVHSVSPPIDSTEMVFLSEACNMKQRISYKQ